MSPELTYMAPLLDQEYKALDELENQLKEAGGGFNVSYEVLQDTMKCEKNRSHYEAVSGCLLTDM
jgi:hypothetical protein